jgi:hypothetical protein
MKYLRLFEQKSYEERVAEICKIKCHIFFIMYDFFS